MTDTDWLECSDPEFMMLFLRETSDRKLRLLSVAVCRRVEHLMANEESRRALEIAERFADGLATEGERIGAEFAVLRASAAAFNKWEADVGAEEPPAGVSYWAAAAAIGTVMSVAYEGAAKAVSEAGLGLAWSEDESLVAGPDYWAGIDLGAPWPGVIREVVGNPFRPITLNPSLLNDTVVKLASTIYHEQAWDRLAVLADALEESCSGAIAPELLEHLRSDGPHYRGCWGIDCVLGRR